MCIRLPTRRRNYSHLPRPRRRRRAAGVDAGEDRFDGHYRAGGPSDRCLALYTLAVAGRPEQAYQELLFSKRNQLSTGFA